MITLQRLQRLPTFTLMMRPQFTLRFFSFRVMVKGVPESMQQDEIMQRFSKISGLQDVYRVKSSTGQATNKVVVTYADKLQAEQCISQFNNRAVDNLVC